MAASVFIFAHLQASAGLGQTAAGTEFKKREVESIRGRSEFLTTYGAGAMAMLPGIRSGKHARTARSYDVFPRSGFYEVDEASNWFIINHRVGNGGSPGATYVGIAVAKVLGKDLDEQLQLLRNKAGKEVWQPSEAFKDEYASPEKFWELHADESVDLPAFEQVFGEWHALVSGELSTWERRQAWKPTHTDCWSELKKRLDREVQENRVYVQARLVAFTPTTSRDSIRPVVWSLALDDADAVYVGTFSPGRPGFERDYCIAIGDGN